jgi:hypothetical protein
MTLVMALKVIEQASLRHRRIIKLAFKIASLAILAPLPFWKFSQRKLTFRDGTRSVEVTRWAPERPWVGGRSRLLVNTCNVYFGSRRAFETICLEIRSGRGGCRPMRPSIGNLYIGAAAPNLSNLG